MVEQACATEELAELVVRAQAGNPFGRVSLVVASPAAAVVARRRIARRRPVANLQSLTLGALAASIAAPHLEVQGRAPLTAAVRRRAVAAAIADAAAEGVDLGAAADHPATVQAIDGRIRELRRCSTATLRALRAGEAVTPLFAVFDRFRERVAVDWYDDVDVLEEAVRQVTSGRAARVVGTVVVDAVQAACDAERRFVAALDASGLLAGVVDGAGGDPSSVRASQVLVAPEPETEVRLAVREVLRLAASGVGLDAVAIVHPGEPYTRLVTELLDAAGVPWSGRGATSAADGVAGRALLGLLGLRDGEVSRADLMALLASAPIVDPRSGEPVPSARWERISRDAHVIAGRAQWDARLGRLASEIAADEARHGRATGVLRDIDTLRRFVADLAEAIEPPAVRTWASMTAWATGLLRYLGPVDAADRERVEAAVASLAVLDAVERRGDVHPTVFAQEVLAHLRARVDRHPIGHGVLVGRPHELAGVVADAVIVLGMNEGAFPRRRRDDPLVADALRATTGGELLTRRERRMREHAELAQIVGRAGESVLCAARADQRAQQRRHPSRWLLAWAPPVDGVTPRRAGDVRPVASFSAAVLGDAPTSDQEAALHHLTAGGDPAALTLGRAADAVRARHSSSLSEWEGVIGEHVGLSIDKRVLSPTAIEVWATCPFKHLLRTVLRVEPTATPEDRVGTDPLERGTLVHLVLERFVRWRIERGAGATGEERAAVLDHITTEVCHEFETAGRVGRAVPWELERRTLRADLAAVLAIDTADAHETGFEPRLAEASFGLGRDDELAVAEVELADGRVVRFRGQVDRVDVTADGRRVRVVDYKTGRSAYYKRDLEARRGQQVVDPTAGGKRLQLPVYAMAVAPSHPGATITAEYWFVTDAAKGYPRVAVTLDERTEERFVDVLTQIADGIEGGDFPAVPGADQLDTWENCRRCDYDRVCPARRSEAFERRKGEDAIVRFLGLKDLE